MSRALPRAFVRGLKASSVKTKSPGAINSMKSIPDIREGRNFENLSKLHMAGVSTQKSKAENKARKASAAGFLLMRRYVNAESAQSRGQWKKYCIVTRYEKG